MPFFNPTVHGKLKTWSLTGATRVFLFLFLVARNAGKVKSRNVTKHTSCPSMPRLPQPSANHQSSFSLLEVSGMYLAPPLLLRPSFHCGAPLPPLLHNSLPIFQISVPMPFPAEHFP
jgi:hypothetical protein